MSSDHEPRKDGISKSPIDEFLVPLQLNCVYYDPTFLSPEQASSFYEALWKKTPWKTSAKINRWVCLMHDDDEDNSNDNTATTTTASSYQYRDAPDASIPFSETVRMLQHAASDWYYTHTNGMHGRVQFNVCLLNFYETGQQRIGWHTDREELGRTTPIASISLGAPRTFLLRSQTNGVHDRASLVLQSGSLVVMENQCQVEYVHSIPKEDTVTEGRINLTFRCKTETTAGEVAHAQRDTWLDRLVADSTTSNNNGTTTEWKKEDDDGAVVVFGDGVPHGPSATPASKELLQYIITTNLGAERYCAAELLENNNSTTGLQVVARPWGWDGCVGLFLNETEAETVSSSPAETLTKLLLQLRSAQHILDFHAQFELLKDLEGEEVKSIPAVRLYEYVKQQLVDGKIVIPTVRDAKTFRVSCERIGGPHGFKSIDVEFEVGGALSEYYNHCKPKLQDYDVNVRAYIVGPNVILGTQLNVVDLSKRHFLEFRNAVTIKTNIAYVMVRCANIKEGDYVVDPFCGSGTILLEAMEMYHNTLRCFGMDISKRTIEGARKNAAAENCGTNCSFVCGDARTLRRHIAEDASVDAVVSNLPWGVMTGHRMDSNDLQTMYEVFLRTIWYTLKDRARVVMFVLRGLQMTRILRKLGGRYRILSVNVVRTTNNLPSIIVVEKLAVDELHRSIKGQLTHLHQYVNINKEIYETIHTEQIE